MSSDLVAQLPAGFEQWPPLSKAAAIFFFTFVLEDAAAVGAGLLLAAGAMTWAAAFWSCFLGIWMGDAGLYGLARGLGRNWFERVTKHRFRKRIERSERWFSERGASMLVFSRVLPGARLPTYLAAGFLRLPFNKFLSVTGVAALVWTIAVLILTHFVGAQVLGWLRKFHRGGWMLLALIPFMLVLLRLLKAFVRPKRELAASFGRMRRWEFWPAWIFYPPVAFYAVWLAIKYRGWTLPTSANPGIFLGGMVGESKMATLNDLMATSPEFTAEAELIKGKTPEERFQSIQEICRRRAFSLPFIMKPDLGQRGSGVKLIRTDDQARAYLARTDAPLVVQRYVADPEEVGIFYYRFPDEPKGSIFAVTEKIFPYLIGDGKSTIVELIWNDSRARFMAGKYLERLGPRQNDVPAAGEKLPLVLSGNHAQGCIFRDGARFVTPELTARIDAISQKLNGFNIGRYDIRYESEEDLRAGRNFMIIELNGAASEATSIYDERNSLWTAYRTLFRQWELVFAVGAANRRHGCAPARMSEFLRNWHHYHQNATSYPTAD